ncbi:hypothetical protein ACKWTF_014155 [Chironomus riparius]
MQFKVVLFYLLYLSVYESNQSFTATCDFSKFARKVHKFVSGCNHHCAILQKINQERKVQLHFLQHEETAKVEALRFDRNNISVIPDGIDTYFPKLKALIFFKVGLRKITSDDFKNLTNLEFLNLNCNQIVVLGENLFQFSTKLTHILMIQNFIVTINPTTFNDLNSLTTLDLSHNLCYNNSAFNHDDVKKLLIDVKLHCWNETLDVLKCFSLINETGNKLDYCQSQCSNHSNNFDLLKNILLASLAVNFIAFCTTYYVMRSTIQYFESIKSTWNQHVGRQPIVQIRHSQPQIHLNFQAFDHSKAIIEQETIYETVI